MKALTCPWLGRVLVLLCALVACTTSAEAQVLRLRTGKLLIGTVETADEDGIRIKRLDTGGVLDLKWSDIVNSDADDLRRQFHLVGEEGTADILVPAMRITFSRGGTSQEIVGEFVSRDAQSFLVRRLGVDIKINVADMRAPPEKIEVPIRDILTPDEIYHRRVAEVAPGDDPNRHVELGVYLIRAQEYERAKEHFEKAKELGGGDQPKELDFQLARVESLLKNKEEADLINEINVLRSRRIFAKALDKCKEYEKRYSDGGKLKSEYEDRKRLLMRDRETHLVREVTNEWYRALGDEAGKIARNRALSFDEARNQAEEKLGETIRQRVARAENISVEEADQFFKMRFDRKVAKVQQATYSTGSWVLGEQGVIKDTAQAKAAGPEAKPQESEQDQRMRELRRRMQEFLRNAQKAQGQGAGQGQKLQTEDEWWKEAESTTRRMWIMAFYAENNGDMKVSYAGTTECPQCGGRGFLEFQGTVGGGTVKVTCPLCHKTRFLRSIRFW